MALRHTSGKSGEKWRTCQSLHVDETALSQREIEVFRWISTGKSDWAISQILKISPKTVNFHVENVKRKFGVGTRIQAIVAVVKSGVLDR